MLPLILLLSLLSVTSHLNAAAPTSLLFLVVNSTDHRVWSPTETDVLSTTRKAALTERDKAEQRLRKETDKYQKTTAYQVYLAEIALLTHREKELVVTRAASPFEASHWNKKKRRRSSSRSDLDTNWRASSTSPSDQPPNGRASTETTSSIDSDLSLVEQPPNGRLPRFISDVRILPWRDFTKE
jgi:hypothetical protein